MFPKFPSPASSPSRSECVAGFRQGISRVVRSSMQVAMTLAVLMAAPLALSTSSQAQEISQAVPANPARITEAVDNSKLTKLKGNVHPLARKANDKGAADSSLAANRMQLILRRSPSQEIALRQFLGALQDKNSSQFRKWLTPEQFGAQYGVADADIQAVSTWLESEGFKVNGVNKAKTIIEFSGSMGQIETAFHTQIHNVEVNGEKHLTNLSDPQIPTALAPVVVGISHLNNFFPKSQHTPPTHATYDAKSKKYVPQLTAGDANSGYFLYVGPSDAATIYDTPSKLNSNFSGGTTYDGSGVTIGVAGDANIVTSDVSTFRSLFGLSNNTPTVVVDGNDPGINGDTDEALLDLEVSGGVAPGANIIFYTAADTILEDGLDLAITRALDDNAVSILNVSFGGCEINQGTANQTIFTNWEQAAAQGITVTVSTGDSGSAGCDNNSTETQAQFGLNVNGLASTPFNIAVGGTDFDVLNSSATSFLTYVAALNNSTYGSARGYIPEEPWNNSTSSNGPLASNTPFMDSQNNNQTNIVGAGGGASSCVMPSYDVNNNLICEATTGTITGWAKPPFQTGGNINIPNDGVRDLPDVSFLAGNGFYSATWVVCGNDFDANGNPIADCVPDSQGNIPLQGFGGTSASAPAFAGMLALVSQSLGNVRLGQANYVLYNLANQAGLYGSVFHDVTTGNNSMYCLSGTSDCGTNSFLTGYDAGTEYDLASGLGSVDVSQLIKSWSSAVFTPTTTTFTINGGTSAVNITHGQTVTFNASVAGAGGTPSGDVGFVTNSNEQASANYLGDGLGFVTLNNGATGAVTYANLPGGSYTVSAYYGGDINFAQSQANPGVQVNVAKENSVLNLGLYSLDTNNNPTALTPGSFPYGTFFGVDASPVGVSQVNSQTPASATGTVTFTDTAATLPGSLSGSAAGVVQITSQGFAELPVYYWPPASHSVSASYSGDNSLNSSTAGPLAFTITQAPTADSVSPSATSVSSGTFTVTSVVTPNPASFATSPTGTITLTANGTTIGTGAVTGTQDPTTGASLGSVTITVNVSALASGANTITSSYSGDTNYVASTGTTTVTSSAMPAQPGFALASTGATVSSPGQSATSTVTITPASGYTGTVNLTCALTSSPTGANATYNPTCSLAASSVKITSTSAGTVTATFATTAPTSGALAFPQTNRWYTAAGGAALACLLFVGIPARRRSWKSMLSLLIFLVAMAGVGCGGGSGNNHNSGTPGTTAGTYTFTVTGTDSVTATKTANALVTVTVE
ncbi:putative periplasmic aspartyl protease [Acidisarcina polymorpha]|uniref:Putative periplasmic aspartyl protease n=1 Tax=Acidisarcina polymorpha TaxID=2211140 RepID=A0A2Z5G9B9_9BACT|nr:protease pro-enzyme activation domain-containing protein [Acidisarcina polymorpha]AXC15146.1 putative periplasmic aspartyl protease [Acidisarcina polymorpha]